MQDNTPRLIQLKREEYDKMLAHALAQTPLEACGLIAGRETEAGRLIEKVYLLTNIDQSPEHFSLDPKEHLAAIRDMRKLGLKPLGNWHSHPATPSRPSEEDKRLAYDNNASYLILSLAGEEPVLNAFHIDGAESRKEILEIIE